jgi:pimeloyl-ACP methyl ester carboxylesterase
MSLHMIRFPPRCRERVIALHCSGAGAGQWDKLAEALGDQYDLLAPEHYGCTSTGPWSGERAFRLAYEAAQAIALIDESREKVHLVGHSYGGGVALHVALARPDQIASMALYEPSAFHLLRQLGEAGAEAAAEIDMVASRVCEGVITGDYRGGMAAFVDYWNGSDAWKAMRPGLQQALMCWAPKAPLDFQALLHEPSQLPVYRGLSCEVLILRGEHAPKPTHLIAEILSQLLPNNRLVVVGGAGHMGPLTHATEVSRLIVKHISALTRDNQLIRGVTPAQPLNHWAPRHR